MPKLRQTRGSIEKRFLTSIIWVGVIPVFLAVSIGYFFAQEAQWNAVKENLEQSAHDKAQGIQLALQGRLEMTKRIAQDQVVVSSMARRSQEGIAALAPAMRHLFRAADCSGFIASNYALYDSDGRYLGGTQPEGVVLASLEEEVMARNEVSFVDFDYFLHENRFAEQGIGFVVESHD